jgi:hypothetical protein
MLTSTGVSQEATPFAQWTQTIKGSAMREMFPLVARPNLISFALGLPAPELLPLAACRTAAMRALSADPQALQYQAPPESLKRHLQKLLVSRGVNCREDQIFLTSGAQQAIHLLANLLLNPGERVVVEEVTYEGARMAIQSLRPEVLVVPTEPETGMDIDAIEAHLVLGARPAFIYAITDGHNPLGLSLSQAARIRLVELARRFRVPIIEDDVTVDAGAGRRVGILHRVVFEDSCAVIAGRLDRRAGHGQGPAFLPQARQRSGCYDARSSDGLRLFRHGRDAGLPGRFKEGIWCSSRCDARRPHVILPIGGALEKAEQRHVYLG